MPAYMQIIVRYTVVIQHHWYDRWSFGLLLAALQSLVHITSDFLPRDAMHPRY